MANLEELVVSLVAETKDLRKGLNDSVKATEKATQGMSDAVKAFTDESAKKMGFFETAMSTALGVFAAQATMAGIGLLKDAVSGLIGIMTDGVAAAQAEEAAISRLNIALANSGQYTKETSNSILEMADALSKASSFGGEVITENAALIQSLGQLDEQGLKRATASAVDLAAGLNIDLKQAATLVGKAAAGEVSSFKKFGIQLDDTGSRSKNFANALDAINARFGGSAAASVRTYGGVVNQLQSAWGDIGKELGKGIIQNQVVIAVLNEVKNVIGGVVTFLQNNEVAWKDLVARGIMLTIDALAALILVADGVGRSLEAAFNLAKAAIMSLVNPIVGFLDLVGAISDETAQAFYDEWTDAATGIGDAFTKDTALGGVADKLADIKAAANEGFRELKSGAEVAIEPINNATVAMTGLTEEQEKQNEALKSFATALAERGANVQSQYEYELALLQSNFAAKQISEEEYLAARMLLLQENQALEQEQLQMARDQNLITEQDFANAKLALVRKQALDAKKIADDQRKFEEETNKLRTQNLASTLSTISSLASSGSKELAAIGKAAAISTATIDGIAAVQKALASAPPPFNFALAAAVGAATAANVAKIAGVGLNKGGTLTGGGANTDRIPATLTPGETVIDRSTTDKLKNFLDTGGQQSRVVVELSMREELIEWIEAKITERQAEGVSLIGVS